MEENKMGQKVYLLTVYWPTLSCEPLTSTLIYRQRKSLKRMFHEIFAIFLTQGLIPMKGSLF
jgi:hypothetical protein